MNDGRPCQQQADEAAAAAPPPEAAPPPAAEPVDSATEKINELAELHASGAITDDEFAAAKAKALGIGWPARERKLGSGSGAPDRAGVRPRRRA